MEAELVIVGAGPAGLTAGYEAAAAGAKVLLVDENLEPGGQLAKQIHKFFGSDRHYAGLRGYKIAELLVEKCLKAGVDILTAHEVFNLNSNKVLGIKTKNKSYAVRAKNIILATGVRENPIAFKGWTLPGIVTIGGLQTMMNVHRVLPGKRFVVLGSGNAGLVVAHQILLAGGEVMAVVEARPKIGGYKVHADKLRKAGIPFYLGSTIKEARGNNKVEGVLVQNLLTNVDPIWLETDCVALAAGFHPNYELADLSGAKINVEAGALRPFYNSFLETTVPGIFVAGDAAGVEEASIAMEEGRLVGLVSAARLGYLSSAEAKGRINEVLRTLKLLRQPVKKSGRNQIPRPGAAGKITSWSPACYPLF